MRSERPPIMYNNCNWKIKRNQRSIPTRDLTRFCWSMFHCHYHHEPSPRTWSSFPLPPWTLTPLPMPGCQRPKLQLQLNEIWAVFAANRIFNLLSHFLSLISLHPLYHKSSKSWNVKQRITSFGLWGPMGERLLIRSSSPTFRLLLDLRSLQVLHITKARLLLDY